MSLPPPETALYNHPLPEIEGWLISQGCKQNREKLNYWRIEKPNWEAELCLDVEQLTVRYFNFGGDGKDIQRSFKYSLSRQDIQEAVFSGP